MQYPIIDLITSAYINNGWTGLDISNGKNLLDINSSEQGGINASGELVSGTIFWRSTNYIEVEQNTVYTFSSITPLTLRIYFYTNDYTYQFRVEDNNYISITFTPPTNCKYIKWSLFKDAGITFSDVEEAQLQIELGNTRTTYEPYSEPKNDFPNRLKLPLPHYFLHPVIDALTHASAGTQTAEDTQILKHYLEPLGIGGI